MNDFSPVKYLCSYHGLFLHLRTMLVSPDHGMIPCWMISCSSSDSVFIWDSTLICPSLMGTYTQIFSYLDGSWPLSVACSCKNGQVLTIHFLSFWDFLLKQIQQTNQNDIVWKTLMFCCRNSHALFEKKEKGISDQ